MDAKTLKKIYELNLKELQDSCPHEKTTDMEYHFAPGHFGGMVTVCDNCDKVIKKLEPNHNINFPKDKAPKKDNVFDDERKYC